jgi:muramidase (phage lysozyme)
MDQTAKQFLDFIGNKEAPKGYGQVYGGAEEFLNRDLTQMTVSEVRRWQDHAVRQGSRSSAAGRYQIIRETLDELIADLGLTGGERFTPELQDRLGYQLLKKRGYERWMSGEMGGANFARELAKEWASMPVIADTKGARRRVRRGESYYAGDGLNAALTEAGTLEALISGGEAARRSWRPGVTAPSSAGSAPMHSPKPTPRPSSAETPSSALSWTRRMLSASQLNRMFLGWLRVPGWLSKTNGSDRISFGNRER